MQSIINKLNKLINATGYFSALLMMLMLINIFYDVLMRYLFNNGNIGMQEMEWHLFSAMFMLGLGYTMKEDGHVRIDVFYDHFSQPKKAIVNIFGALVFTLPFSLMIIYFGTQYTYDAFLLNEGSGDPGGLPNRWIIRSVIPISFGFLILCLVQVILVNSLTLLVKREAK